MSLLLARTGRHRQRYVDQFRLVAGCIPYKFNENSDVDQTSNVKDWVLVLMISSPKHDDLVFPKGGWENDETLDQAARREALEEAGVRGILGENPLGEWDFRSKSTQSSCSSGGGCRGYMFALEVTEELDYWPGKANYNRKWLPVKEAFEHCRYDWMRDALKRFLESISKVRKVRTMEESADVVPLIIPVSDIGVETQLVSPSCSHLVSNSRVESPILNIVINLSNGP